MNSESTTTVDTRAWLAISAEYLGMVADAVVACGDRSIEPFGNFNNSDCLLHDDSERLRTIMKQWVANALGVKGFSCAWEAQMGRLVFRAGPSIGRL